MARSTRIVTLDELDNVLQGNPIDTPKPVAKKPARTAPKKTADPSLTVPRAIASRGEANLVINGKTLHLIPTFGNIDRFETDANMSIFTAANMFTTGDIRMGLIARLLVIFNEGDQVSFDEVIEFVYDIEDPLEFQKLLVPVLEGVFGKAKNTRAVKATDEEIANNPN